MVKRKTDSGNKKESSVAERKFGVVLEDINSKFSQIMEGNAALNNELEDFRGEFNDFRNEANFKFDVLTGELNETKTKVSTIETKISNIESKYDKNFDQILKYLFRIDEEIQDLKQRLDKKADLERLLRLEQQVAQMQLVVNKLYEEGQNSN